MVIRKDKTKTELAEYLHKSAFSPSLSTFQRAIRKGHLLTWPGIEDINFEKYISNLIPTAKGHLDQARANLQSTKNKEDPLQFLTAMMVGDPEEDSVTFLLNQAPPLTGYFIDLTVTAGDDSND